jgi:hypothetical protein
VTLLEKCGDATSISLASRVAIHRLVNANVKAFAPSKKGPAITNLVVNTAQSFQLAPELLELCLSMNYDKNRRRGQKIQASGTTPRSPRRCIIPTPYQLACSLSSWDWSTSSSHRPPGTGRFCLTSIRLCRKFRSCHTGTCRSTVSA